MHRVDTPMVRESETDSYKRVVIVEDNPFLRDQLVAILAASPDIRCKYVVSTGEEALLKIPESPPDLVLMDINLPGMSGIDCTLQLKGLLPNLEILVLTVYEDCDSIFRALRAGATGYLIKSCDPEDLFNAIRDVHSGGARFSSHIARKVVQHFHRNHASKKNVLSEKETEVIELLAKGYTYREIGDCLGIQIETVRTHVKRICFKMQVSNRVEAVAKHLS